MKYNCKNCHFLARSYRAPGGVEYLNSWSIEERESGTPHSDWSAQCALGVWDTGIDPRLNDSLHEILNKSRKNFCFHIEPHDGMSFEAARQLQAQRASNRDLKRSNMYTQIGLFIAGLALLANVIVEILKAPNQRVDPTVKTPVESGRVQGTAGHP
ncbi:hypothetical protein P4E94_19160 [Pontiellaceae bacterium B12219]|nr:hypothetical protein [Pontiellaceae bacterium B12219]